MYFQNGHLKLLMTNILRTVNFTKNLHDTKFVAFVHAEQHGVLVLIVGKENKNIISW